MADNLRLRVILDMVEKVVAPLKRVSAGSSDTARSLKAARDRLKELNQQQSQVSEFRTLRQQLKKTTGKLGEAQAKVQQLARSYGQAGPPTKAMARDLRTATKEAATLAQQQDNQRARLQQLHAGLSAAGISTRQLGQHSRNLRGDIAATSAAIAQQTERLKANADQHRRIKELNARHAKAMLHTGMAAGAGVAASAAGRRGVQAGMGPVTDFATHEAHMLGVARQVQGARDDAGNLTDVYRTVERQVRELSQVVPMATTEIADMVTAAARMEVPTDQLKEFTLMASEMATAFDAVPDEITESMGKVAKNFKIPLTDIRSLADSINYLDDNAISKGADIIDFLNRTSGVVSTVAMSARDAAALGSTLLTLGERTETAGTAANAIVQKFAAASKGTAKFQSAMAEIGLSSQSVQMGMSTDATATLLKVIEAVRKLPESQRIGVMVELVGMQHSDTLAKLVDKPEELQRQLGLANGQEAQGSMAREAAARNATLNAQWRMTQNRMFNLRALVGETLLPVLTDTLKIVNPLLESMFKWVRAHPALVKWILSAVVGLSALLAVLGTLLVPLAVIAGKFMLVRFMLQRLSITAGGTLVSALRSAGTAAAGIGRALLMTPLGAIVAGIAVAALLVYKYWQPLAAFFSGLWKGFSDAMAPAFSAVGSALAPLRPGFDWLMGALGATWNWFTSLLAPMRATQSEFAGITNAGQFLGQVLGTLVMGFLNIPSAFLELGQNVIGGFVNGITAGATALRNAVVSMASSISAWFRETLGIASPSKVFLQYGGWVSEGAALGITGGQDAVRKAAMGVATAATMAMPMAASAAALQIDARPPLSAQAMGSGYAPAGAATYNITINAAPGMDGQAIARAVAAELERQRNKQRAAVRSNMSDVE